MDWIRLDEIRCIWATFCPGTFFLHGTWDCRGLETATTPQKYVAALQSCVRHPPPQIQMCRSGAAHAGPKSSSISASVGSDDSGSRSSQTMSDAAYPQLRYDSKDDMKVVAYTRQRISRDRFDAGTMFFRIVMFLRCFEQYFCFSCAGFLRSEKRFTSRHE